ncbi:MAG TPA: TlpA disulfide reductase family protein [Xanthobacteraceae bacterium]|jgi:thiol-disulfide isomerase/thioredoxin
MKPTDQEKRAFARRRLLVVLLGGAAGVLAGMGLLYGINALKGNPASVASSCQPALELAKRVAPHVRGEVAALNVATKPLQLPQMSFRDAGGQERTMADFRGRTVLLNLWATWCVPCRKEMPALEALQAKLGGENFEVVAINIDTRDPDKPKNWLKEVGITKLGYYADPTAKVFQDLKEAGKAFGMPTTLLVDPQGCEVATLAGPAEWASEDAIKLMQAALARS